MSATDTANDLAGEIAVTFKDGNSYNLKFGIGALRTLERVCNTPLQKMLSKAASRDLTMDFIMLALEVGLSHLKNKKLSSAWLEDNVEVEEFEHLSLQVFRALVLGMRGPKLLKAFDDKAAEARASIEAGEDPPEGNE